MAQIFRRGGTPAYQRHSKRRNFYRALRARDCSGGTLTAGVLHGKRGAKVPRPLDRGIQVGWGRNVLGKIPREGGAGALAPRKSGPGREMPSRGSASPAGVFSLFKGPTFLQGNEKPGKSPGGLLERAAAPGRFAVIRLIWRRPFPRLAGPAVWSAKYAKRRWEGKAPPNL